MARIFPTQAVPIFLDKLRTVCFYIRNHVVNPAIKPPERFVAVRDLAFFSVDFSSGDRGSDLERAKSVDVLPPPPPPPLDKNGFIVNQGFGKTLKGNGRNFFVLKPIQGAPFCPVTNLRYLYRRS